MFKKSPRRPQTRRSRRRTQTLLAAFACVGLACGGSVLLNSAEPTEEETTARTSEAGSASETAPSAAFQAPGIEGELALSQSEVFGAEQIFARLRLRGTGAEDVSMPTAISVVLDVSGSMSGGKIAQAKRSLLSLVERMGDQDLIAVTTYSDAAVSVVPMSPVRSVRAAFPQIVAGITVRGGTNIPSGLNAGGDALATVGANFARRIVLLSDGVDGSGQAPSTVARAVRARSRGAAISSLGIGTDYDENFLMQIADAGNGNYEFLATPSLLASFLDKELASARTTAARALNVALSLPTGVTIARVYGAEHVGNTLSLGSLSSGEDRQVVVALRAEKPDGAIGAQLSFLGPDGDTRSAAASIPLATATSVEAAVASRDLVVHAETHAVAIDAQQREAITQWRSGNARAAAAQAMANAAALEQLAEAAPTPALRRQIAEYQRDATTFGQVSAMSSRGAAYGLSSNASRRRRARSAR